MKPENIISKCPVCGAPTNLHYKPFCSKHCADVDLNRWFTGNYVVHTNEPPAEEDLMKVSLSSFENHETIK